MKVIALSGKIGAGKSHLANYIQKSYAYGRAFIFVKPIAESLKNFCVKYKLCNPYQKNDEWLPGLTNRTVLQEVGQLMKRYNPNIWLDMWLNSVNEHSRHSDIIIVDDIRFLKEIEYIKSHALGIFKLIRITNPNQPEEYHGCNDISETELDNYPFEYYYENVRGTEANFVEYLREEGILP